MRGHGLVAVEDVMGIDGVEVEDGEHSCTENEGLADPDGGGLTDDEDGVGGAEGQDDVASVVGDERHGDGRSAGLVDPGDAGEVGAETRSTKIGPS